MCREHSMPQKLSDLQYVNYTKLKCFKMQKFRKIAKYASLNFEKYNVSLKFCDTNCVSQVISCCPDTLLSISNVIVYRHFVSKLKAAWYTSPCISLGFTMSYTVFAIVAALVLLWHSSVAADDRNNSLGNRKPSVLADDVYEEPWSTLLKVNPYHR